MSESPTNQPTSAEQASGTIALKPTRLVIHLPDGSQKSASLTRAVTRIGRGTTGNQIAVPLTLGSVSREHLEIRLEGTHYLAADLNSQNGVLVNGQRIQGSVVLHDGDDIRIGSAVDGQEVRIMFEEGVSFAAAAPAVSTQQMPAWAAEQVAPAGAPYLAVRWPQGQTSSFQLSKDVTLVGRAPEADLRFPDNLRYISGRHAEIRRAAPGFEVTDLGSTNGTRLNNQPLKPNTPVPLRDGSVIRIGDENFGVSVGITFFNPEEAKPPVDGFTATFFNPPTLAHKTGLIIGRAPDCDIVLDHPTVSRRHARLEHQGDSARLIDLDSINGVYVNGQRVKTAEVKPGDLIQIEHFVLLYQDDTLVPFESNGMRVDVVGLSKDVRSRGKKRHILDDISLTVMPREFVALVGGSGAGKSTLMNALIGISPGSGQVQLNGRDFNAEFDQFRSQLGYVPQADIIHLALTVEQALSFAARLRLPADVSAKERQERISRALETVGMNTDVLRKTKIGDLSGGQRKRVSIATELLADPKLIYLDEATSGLDPGLEKKMMYTLRNMADEGRTVVLITHATANIVQTDHVAFLSQGVLDYFGPPQDALGFFEVEGFEDIYEQIDGRGREWRETFREKKSSFFQQYVLGRQATLRAAAKATAPRSGFNLGELIRQFVVLTERALAVITSDIVTLILLLLLFPVTATLQLAIATPQVLTGNLSIIADPVAAAAKATSSYIPLAAVNTFVFVMGLEAVLVGMYVPSTELIKERSVYLRERMVSLRVVPYLLSKVAIFMLFSAVQVLLYLLLLSRGVDIPAQGVYFPGAVELFITLFLTMVAGVGIGLLVSAVSRNSDMAIYVLVMMMFFEFFFAGTVFDLRGNRFEPLSYLTTTRWALTAIGVTVDMPKQVESTILCNDVPANPLDPNSAKITKCFNYPDARKDLLLPYDQPKLLLSWGILALMAVTTVGATGVLIRRLDAI